QDAEEMLFQLFHASHSSMRLSDSTVITTLSAPTRLTGSSAAASTTCTYGTLRAARYSASGAFSATSTTRPAASSSDRRETSCAVLGCSTPNDSTSEMRFWRFSSDRIETIAPRYILRLIFCAK